MSAFSHPAKNWWCQAVRVGATKASELSGVFVYLAKGKIPEPCRYVQNHRCGGANDHLPLVAGNADANRLRFALGLRFRRFFVSQM
jgi:hypothetical protein